MIRNVSPSEKNAFNKLALHPLQSWEWGEFRLKTGIEVLRLGRFAENILVETAQITIHPIPFTSYKIGYFPKGGLPSHEMLAEMMKIGRKNNFIFIKLEPNINKENFDINNLNRDFPIKTSPHPLFTHFTFQLDLTESEENLLKKMNSKTRYNTRLAEKKGVKVAERNDKESFAEYLRLMEETTLRQKFYAHTISYHSLMWETLNPVKIARLFTAKYNEDDKDTTLVAWVLFLFNNVLYYPYGASTNRFRNLMPSNLMMWEAIKFGKANGAKLFDMWGALGANPDPKDPWYGFHKFKEGYGAHLVELAGSFDLVVKPVAYSIYNLLHYLREGYLKIKR